MNTFLCLVLSIILAVFLFFKKKYSYWKDRGVKYVEPSFPMGNFPFVRAHFKDFIANLYKYKENSPLLGAYIVTKPVVIAVSLDFIQKVLVSDFSSFHERGMYANEADDPLSAHMFSLDGERWKSIRTKLSPTFTSGKMKHMFPIVVEVADRFNDTLASIVKVETQLDMKDLLGRFTTDVIGTCAFGIECNSLEDPESMFRHYGRKVFDDPHLSPFMQMLVIQYPKLGQKLHIKVLSPDVAEFFLDSVGKTIEYREKNNVRRNDFMDLLIQLKNGSDLENENAKQSEKLSLEEVAAQAFLFFAAGFETSSTTMMYCLYELALNPDIQEKGRQEINEVLLKYNGQLTYEAIKEMSYVDQIISEALRKYPPAVFVMRKAVHNYNIPNTKSIIEKGTEIFIPVYCIHHDPEIYPEPEIFDPERFSPEQVNNRHSMSFLSFGDGPRNCIGLRFGRMQSRIGLITLLKNYRFTPGPKTMIPIVFDPEKAVLTPQGKMFLQVETI